MISIPVVSLLRQCFVLSKEFLVETLPLLRQQFLVVTLQKMLSLEHVCYKVLVSL